MSATAEPVRVATTPNWTIQGVACSRSRFPALQKESYYKYPGVYVLIGPGHDGKDIVYVGEAERVGRRIEQHKDPFWIRTALFTAQNGALNKAHVKHLEAELVKLGRAASVCRLKNDKQPKLPMLSSHEKAVTAEFLEQILVLMTALGIPYFEGAASTSVPAPTPSEAVPHSVASGDEFQINRSGVVAQGRLVADGFMVMAGAVAAKDHAPKAHRAIRNARKQLIESGVLVEEGDHRRLAQEHVFDSAWLAAGVMFGRTVNGIDEWKDVNGQTLRNIQAGTAAARANA